MLIFDYWIFIYAIISIIVMFYMASKLEDPSKKRVKNIETMLIKHIEDAKFTILTIQNTREEVKNQSTTLNQILEKLN